MKTVGLVGVSAAIGAAAALIAGYLINKPLGGGSGDEPIMMAGGSMYISTSPNYTDDFAPNAGGDLVHSANTAFVRKLEVTDSSENVYPFSFDGSMQVKIDIAICRLNEMGNCRSAGPDGGLETVEFQTTSTQPGSMNQGLKITSITAAGVQTTPMARSLRLLPHLWVHPRRKKSIQSISVTGAASGTPLPAGLCQPDGDCSMIIHYCPNNADCSS